MNPSLLRPAPVFLILAFLSSALSLYQHEHSILLTAFAAYMAYSLICIRSFSPVKLALLLISLTIYLYFSVVTPEASLRIEKSIVIFCAFILAATTLKIATVNISSLQELREIIAEMGRNKQKTSVAIASLGSGAFISFGAIPLIYNLFNSNRDLALPIQRGFSLIPMISPFSVTFVLMTTMLFPVDFNTVFEHALPIVSVFLAIAILDSIRRDKTAAPAKREPRQVDHKRLMLSAFYLMSCVLIIALVYFVSELPLSKSFIPASILILTATALLTGKQKAIQQEIVKSSATFHSEATILLFSAAIGSLITEVNRQTQWVDLSPYLHSPIITLILPIIIIGASALAISPLITVAILCSFIAPYADQITNKEAFYLCITAGWSLSMCISPISITNLLIARETGIPVRQLYRTNYLYLSLCILVLTLVSIFG